MVQVLSMFWHTAFHEGDNDESAVLLLSADILHRDTFFLILPKNKNEFKLRIP